MRRKIVTIRFAGETISKPHKHGCPCTDCNRRAKFDELKFAKGRLNAYKGLASEAYISLSSEDPILTSFELRRELLNVAADETYYLVSLPINHCFAFTCNSMELPPICCMHMYVCA